MGGISAYAGGIVMMGGGVPSGVTPDTISYESNASASKTDGTDLVIAKPASTASGDMLVAVIVQDTNENAVTLPDGWTLIHDIISSSSRTTVAYKEAGGSEGESYTFSNADTYKTGVVARFSKTGGTWDIEAASEVATGSTTSISSTSVTATDNSMLVWFFGSDDNQTITGAPADMTEVATTAPGSLLSGIWYEARSSGAVTKTLTLAGNADMAAIAVVLDLVP